MNYFYYIQVIANHFYILLHNVQSPDDMRCYTHSDHIVYCSWHHESLQDMLKSHRRVFRIKTLPVKSCCKGSIFLIDLKTFQLIWIRWCLWTGPCNFMIWVLWSFYFIVCCVQYVVLQYMFTRVGLIILKHVFIFITTLKPLT